MTEKWKPKPKNEPLLVFVSLPHHINPFTWFKRGWRLKVDIRDISLKVKRLEKNALANSADPDETPHDAASHQGLRCLLK
ncbi:hypothetical protein DPMN_140218 [Dreissena polymorpha]|uniref:Uncharacterized protein n=1 Tax=Dreissena polymorpha TaxID=45954 RepID=A0A9D4JK67_DREPO|nr:hypothetical protein DPMN_140218 [Dreissena polymorpha]